MQKEEVKAAAAAAYRAKGLHGVYALLRKEGVTFKKVTHEFGWEGTPASQDAKREFMDAAELRFHYYSIGLRSSRTGFTCNMLRGIEVILLPE